MKNKVWREHVLENTSLSFTVALLQRPINCWSSEMSLIMRDLSNKTMLWPKLPSIFVVKTVVCLYFSTYVLCRGILVISLWVNSKVSLLINSRHEVTCIFYFVNFYRANFRRKVKVFRMFWKSWEQQKM